VTGQARIPGRGSIIGASADSDFECPSHALAIMFPEPPGGPGPNSVPCAGVSVAFAKDSAPLSAGLTCILRSRNHKNIFLFYFILYKVTPTVDSHTS
jgi:hypothetical protein